MISYDTPEVMRRKVDYIKSMGLGGAMFWETSGDRPCTDEESLINVAATQLRRGENCRLESSDNCLDYPGSKYENLKRGMPSE